jgi:hypothetical protein
MAAGDVEVVFFVAAQGAFVLGVEAPAFTKLAHTAHSNCVFGDEALFAWLKRLHGAVDDWPIHETESFGREAALAIPVRDQVG